MKRKRKRIVFVLALFTAMFLLAATLTQAGEMTLLELTEQLETDGRFGIWKPSGVGNPLILIDTRTGKTWVYKQAKWVAIPFIKGQPFPGDKSYAVTKN